MSTSIPPATPAPPGGGHGRPSTRCTLEAAQRLARAHALGALARDVGDRRRMHAQLRDGDDVQDAVEAPVTAPVQAVARRLARLARSGAVPTCMAKAASLLKRSAPATWPTSCAALSAPRLPEAPQESHERQTDTKLRLSGVSRRLTAPRSWPSRAAPPPTANAGTAAAGRPEIRCRASALLLSD